MRSGGRPVYVTGRPSFGRVGAMARTPDPRAPRGSSPVDVAGRSAVAARRRAANNLAPRAARDKAPRAGTRDTGRREGRRSAGNIDETQWPAAYGEPKRRESGGSIRPPLQRGSEAASAPRHAPLSVLAVVNAGWAALWSLLP